MSIIEILILMALNYRSFTLIYNVAAILLRAFIFKIYTEKESILKFITKSIKICHFNLTIVLDKSK